MTTRLASRMSLFVLAAAAAAPAQALAVKGLDPVALCNGQEVAGQRDLAVRHGAYVYQFATAANAAAFQAAPQRYAIQWDGACARMGPLSGTGDAERFLVYDGRIYIFASDACRDGFRKKPELFLDPDAPKPEPDAEAVAAGARLLERAVASHGGRERLLAWRSYRHDREFEKNGMTEQHRLLCVWPDRMRRDHDVLQGDKAWRYARLLTGAEGAFVDNGKPRPMGDAARRESQRDLLHEPLFALRLASGGGAIVCGRGTNTVGGIAVEEFELWLAACSVVFGVDAEGRVRTARYRGRGPGLWFGAVECVFDDFTTVGGLLLPQSVRATFDGKDAPGLAERRQHLEVDGTIDPKLLELPR